MANHWVITCNPKRWDIISYLEEGNSLLDVDRWSVVRYFDELNSGDDVALWLTGAARGIYGVGTVTGPTFSGVAGGPQWLSSVDQKRPMWFVPIRLTIDLTDNPILGTELQEDARFAGSTLITFPRAGNPHRLDDRQWAAVSARLSP